MRIITIQQLFSQWSGANAITQYSPTIFGYLGVTGMESQFLATGIYGIAKFTSCLAFALFIVDFLGRRRSLMTGIVLQIVTLAYVGTYLGITGNMSTAAVETSQAASRAGTAAIVAISIHAIAWSIGWFSMPYLVGSEIFPIRIRSFNVSVSMAFHWAFYFGSSRSMPRYYGKVSRVIGWALPKAVTVHKVAYPSPEDMRVERRDGKLLADSKKQEKEDAKIQSDMRIEDVSRI
ncbi:quinate permease [Botryosphaeria dothidea]|uniref:Quinate permease n=1 Tax=Botryosphaeria dothidea TaxID=55169 RepID=A0A8H4ITH3_9PEZI|nr:quinate permease [Botryosphaeria dothidea]